MEVKTPYAADIEKHNYIIGVWERLVAGLKGEIKRLSDTQESYGTTDILDTKFASLRMLELARLEKELLIESDTLRAKRMVVDSLIKRDAAFRDENAKKSLEFDKLSNDVNTGFDALLAKANVSTNEKVKKELRAFEAGKLEVLKDQVSKNKLYSDLTLLLK